MFNVLCYDMITARVYEYDSLTKGLKYQADYLQEDEKIEHSSYMWRCSLDDRKDVLSACLHLPLLRFIPLQLAASRHHHKHSISEQASDHDLNT